MTFSDTIVYVDESGDHGLDAVDPDYPIFVLAFCVFDKRTYTESCAPALQRLKFKHWGHDMVILHEREIRKATGEFAFLVDPVRREEFMADLNDLVECSDFKVIASAIEKRKLRERYGRPENPYELALEFCLERLWFLLKRRRQTVHIVFESRGRREDEELELEFRLICTGELPRPGAAVRAGVRVEEGELRWPADRGSDRSADRPSGAGPGAGEPGLRGDRAEALSLPRAGSWRRAEGLPLKKRKASMFTEA